MKSELHALFNRLQSLQLEIHQALSRVNNAMAYTPIGDMVDAGFLCRESSKICQDLKVQYESKQGLIGKVLATKAGAASLQGEALVLEGELATGAPQCTEKPKFPATGTADWKALMRWLGCTDEQIQADMLRPSFTAIQVELTRRLESGEKPPPGVVASFIDVSTVFRTKNRKTSTKEKANGSTEENDF